MKVAVCTKNANQLFSYFLPQFFQVSASGKRTTGTNNKAQFSQGRASMYTTEIKAKLTQRTQGTATATPYETDFFSETSTTAVRVRATG